MEENNKMLEQLMVSLDEMNTKNNKVDINSMYGVFLPKNDRFII